MATKTAKKKSDKIWVAATEKLTPASELTGSTWKVQGEEPDIEVRSALHDASQLLAMRFGGEVEATISYQETKGVREFLVKVSVPPPPASTRVGEEDETGPIVSRADAKRADKVTPLFPDEQEEADGSES